MIAGGAARLAPAPPSRAAALKALTHAACDRLAAAVRWVVIVLAVVMLGSLALQVLMRYVLGRSPSWTEELAVSCFSWSMLLAIAAGVRDAIHVRMDLLSDRLPGPMQAGLDRIVALATAFVGAFIAWSGARYVADTAGVVSAAIGYPLTYLYACAPVCGGLIAVFALERALAGPPPLPAAPAKAN